MAEANKRSREFGFVNTSTCAGRGCTISRTSASTFLTTPSRWSPEFPAPGKSSLAFDTIYAEGQRRYIESLSAYARQFLERIEKPDVDEISGHRARPSPSTEKRHAESAVDGGHRHGNLRLSPPAVRPCRANLLHPLRTTKCGKTHSTKSPPRSGASEPGRRFYVAFSTGAAGTGAEARVRKLAAAQREAVQQALTDLQKRGFNRLYQDGRVLRILFPGNFAGR